MLFGDRTRWFLPRIFGTLSPKTNTPLFSITAHAILGCALALSGSFIKLAVLSTLAACAAYILGCIAAYVLRRRNYAESAHRWSSRPPIFAVIGVVAMAAIAAQATLDEAVGSAIALIVNVRDVRCASGHAEESYWRSA